MTTTKAIGGAHASTPAMCDMQKPQVRSKVTPNLAPPNVSPQGRIQLYNDVEWEEFIREWVTALETDYVQIKRFGGAGDRGADVAAFKTDHGLEGAWDCFQAKHYSGPLGFADAGPEILKVFRAVDGGHWSMPDSYQFLAPRGCGTSLNQLLSQPTNLKARFLQDLSDPQKPLGRDLGKDERAAIATLASGIDFAIFQSVELLDAIAAHRTTVYHVERFGTALADRPTHDAPPDDVRSGETRYVEQLIAVYKERHPNDAISIETIPGHADIGSHFLRQREAFYKAESLRVYARDSVPPGTFDLLQEDIYAGVVDIADVDHPNGWTRLSKTLAQVVGLPLDHHTLIHRSDLEDRKGICHQLANADRLTWVRP